MATEQTPQQQDTPEPTPLFLGLTYAETVQKVNELNAAEQTVGY